MSETPEPPSLYTQLNARDTTELLAIWTRSDADECSPEELVVLSAILTERLGNLPSHTPAARRKHIKKAVVKRKDKNKARFSVGQVWSILAGLIVFALLAQSIGSDRWIPVLIFSAVALLFLVPGFLIGRRAWFQRAQMEQAFIENSPDANEPADGIIARIFPERNQPQYFIWLLRLISIACLIGGIAMIVLLIRLF